MLHLPFKVGVSRELKIRGIVAIETIKRGQVIERCPLILSRIDTEEENLKKTVLWKYYYEYNEYFHALVLGYGSLINHSYKPNARYTYDFKNKLVVYRALRDITSGEEITVNYNFFPGSKKQLPTELTDYNAHLKS